MEVFVARQPIFDRGDRIAGYELLYRQHRRSRRAPAHVGPEMSGRLIVDTILGIGLDEVTEGQPAYINCTRELLLSELLELLDPREVVLEILETVVPDAPVVAACERLAAAGYRLALDDFVYSERWIPLIRLADVVKVDVLAHPPAALEALVRRLRDFEVTLLAEKVETRATREACLELGFGLFQGFHLRRPELLSRQDLVVAQIRLLELMNLLRKPDLPDEALVEAFQADVSLTYKLLRMANAAALAGRGIESIGHAIRLLGREPLYRWLALLLFSTARSRDGADGEILRLALLRAHMCERLAAGTGARNARGPLFLVGLFSLLDVILGVSMEDALRRLVLAPAVADALLRGTGPYAPTLSLVTAYTAGDWDAIPSRAQHAAVPAETLPAAYLDGLAASREQFALLRSA